MTELTNQTNFPLDMSIKQSEPISNYFNYFQVYDRKHTQTDVPANVTVTVKEIPHEAVINSGSVRIAGITDEQFIRVWDYKLHVSFHQN